MSKTRKFIRQTYHKDDFRFLVMEALDDLNGMVDRSWMVNHELSRSAAIRLGRYKFKTHIKQYEGMEEQQ